MLYNNSIFNHQSNINNSPNGICIDLNESKGYCIGGINRGGCCISINRDVSILKVTYDFNKTEVDCCSLVFFMGGIDIHLYKGITFWLKTKSDIDFFELELHLKTRDISKKIMIERESDWLKYVVYFKDYGGGKQEWTELKEIAFLVYRDDISLATLELKDLMIF